MYYTEHTERGSLGTRLYPYPSFFGGGNWIPSVSSQESRNMSFRVCSWLRILTNLPASIVWPPQDLNMSLHVQQVFPDSSFWLLAVCKNEGRRPERFSHVNDTNVYLGKTEGGEGGDPQSKDRAWGVIVHWGFGPKHLNFKRSWSKWTTPCSRLRDACVKCVLSIRDPSPPLSTDTDVIPAIK